jgi:Amt family ammonium transporter
VARSIDFRLAGDDSLDVVGVHLVGGIVGTVLIGLFANATRGADGAVTS